MTKHFNFIVILKKNANSIFICLPDKKYSVKLFLNHNMFSLPPAKKEKPADLHGLFFFLWIDIN